MSEALSPKAGVFFDRYLHLAQWLADAEGQVTVQEIADAWQCSARTARQTLRRLEEYGLLQWQPQAGRGKRSRVGLRIHPVHVYVERAQQAEVRGCLAEAAFWLSEIMRECPCIPEVPGLLADVRGSLGLRTAPCC